MCELSLYVGTCMNFTHDFLQKIMMDNFLIVSLLIVTMDKKKKKNISNVVVLHRRGNTQPAMKQI